MHIDELLKEALDFDASDLHATVGVPPVLRINGSIVRMNRPALNREDTELFADQLLSSEKKKIFHESGDIDSSYIIPEVGLFRVNCYRQRNVVGVAVRVLKSKISTIEELELPTAVATLARLKCGLILITGPTGSGKSTTMAAMTELINSEKELHIVTLEDPIEYFHKHKRSLISQREIGRDSLSFPNSLRSALRQDPDVIVVGEMRDLETIAIAVTAAETGHLVMATLHTNDSAQTVERIIDVFPSHQQRQIRTQLANSLAGVISQRLVPRKNNNSRIAAVEILVCTPAVRNLIREGAVHRINSTIQSGYKHGMQTMDKHLQILHECGIISGETCREYAADKDSMIDFMERANI